MRNEIENMKEYNMSNVRMMKNMEIEYERRVESGERNRIEYSKVI